MSTNQTMPGTRSPDVIRVTPAFFDQNLGQWMSMVRDYFKKSYDRTSSPEESFKSMRMRLASDDKFFLVALLSYGIPIGFMAGDVVGEVGRITIGYMPPKLTDGDAVISVALDLFDKWCEEHGVVGQVFYSYRSPGSHKFMVKRGWENDLTIYKKELNHG